MLKPVNDIDELYTCPQDLGRPFSHKAQISLFQNMDKNQLSQSCGIV